MYSSTICLVLRFLHSTHCIPPTHQSLPQFLPFHALSCDILFVKTPNRSNGTIRNHFSRLGTVVFHESKPKVQDLLNPKAVNQAPRSGAEVQTIKKFDAGSNKKTPSVVNPRKLDEAAEPAALGNVATEVRQAIQKARLDKKMNQAELAKQINERPQVVQDYKNGKAVPNQAVLAKMERVLGVKLRGKVRK